MTIDFLKGPSSEQQYKDGRFYRKGGMGEIYVADDTINGGEVAVKLIPVDSSDDSALIREEATVALSLSHDRIIKTYFSDTVTLFGSSYFYYTMEYLKNGSLRDLIASRSQTFSIEDSIQYMIDIAEGLEYAHTKIIHRDLKPENILQGNDAHLILCDFGLAKYVDAKTRTHSLKGAGTYAYMAPEAWQGQPNTMAMDVYSAGIMYFEILSLQRPFLGPTELEYRDQHLYRQLPNVIDSRKDAPLRLAEIISKMTDKRPNARFESMSQVKTELVSILSSVGKKGLNEEHDPLALKARASIERTNQARLESQKIIDEAEHRKKMIDYSKESLFAQFEKRVNKVNESLVQGKMRIEKGGNYLHVYFQNKSMSINFFDESQLRGFISNRKEQSIKRQIEQHGSVWFNTTPPRLEADKVLCVGKASESGGHPSEKKWGFNLLLCKTNDDDEYGEWRAAWFDDDGMMALHGPVGSHYSIDSNNFYSAYEAARYSPVGGTRVTLAPFSEELIESLIDRICE